MIENRKVIRLSFNVSFEQAMYNRQFSKMPAENSNKLKLKTYTSTRTSTFTLVTLQSFSISGVISAEKFTDVCMTGSDVYPQSYKRL